MSHFPPVFAGSRRGPLGLVIGCSLAQAVLAIVIAFQMRTLFEQFTRAPMPFNELPVETAAVILLAVMGILTLRVVERASAEAAALDFTKILRVRLFNRLSRLSLDDLTEHKSGALQIRFVGDLGAIKQWVGKAIPGLITSVFLLPTLVFILYSLNPALAVVGSVLIFTCIVVMSLLAPRLHKFHQNHRQSRGNLASLVAARIKHSGYLRVNGARRKIVRRIEKRSNQIVRHSVVKTVVVNGFKSIPDFTLQVLTILALLAALYLGMNAAQGAIILSILAIFQQPLADVAGFWDKRQAYLVSRRKCLQILSLPSITAGPKIRIPTKQRLVLNASNVHYQGRKYPNICVQEGQGLVVTGQPGTGKSTLLNLLVGMLRADSGKVTIQGTNIHFVRESQRTSLCFFEGARTVVFAGSVRSALTFGSSGKVDVKHLEQVIQEVGFQSTLDRLGGMDAHISEDGQNLSKTEVQKIALCRLLLSKARILLIDDIDRFSDDSLHVLNRHLVEQNKLVIATASNSQRLPHFLNQQLRLRV